MNDNPTRKMLVDPLGDARRKATELRRHLRDLTSVVDQALKALDDEMAKPPTPERGRRIAALANGLQLANDSAKRFGLGKRSER